MQNHAAQHLHIILSQAQCTFGGFPDCSKNFGKNFLAVTAWAERTGAQRFQDRDAIHRMSKETVKAAEIYAAIARSL